MTLPDPQPLRESKKRKLNNRSGGMTLRDIWRGNNFTRHNNNGDASTVVPNKLGMFAKTPAAAVEAIVLDEEDDDDLIVEDFGGFDQRQPCKKRRIGLETEVVGKDASGSKWMEEGLRKIYCGAVGVPVDYTTSACQKLEEEGVDENYAIIDFELTQRQVEEKEGEKEKEKEKQDEIERDEKEEDDEEEEENEKEEEGEEKIDEKENKEENGKEKENGKKEKNEEENGKKEEDEGCNSTMAKHQLRRELGNENLDSIAAADGNGDNKFRPSGDDVTGNEFNRNKVDVAIAAPNRLLPEFNSGVVVDAKSSEILVDDCSAFKADADCIKEQHNKLNCLGHSKSGSVDFPSPPRRLILKVAETSTTSGSSSTSIHSEEHCIPNAGFKAETLLSHCVPNPVQPVPIPSCSSRKIPAITPHHRVLRLSDCDFANDADVLKRTRQKLMFGSAGEATLEWMRSRPQNESEIPSYVRKLRERLNFVERRIVFLENEKRALCSALWGFSSGDDINNIGNYECSEDPSPYISPIRDCQSVSIGRGHLSDRPIHSSHNDCNVSNPLLSTCQSVNKQPVAKNDYDSESCHPHHHVVESRGYSHAVAVNSCAAPFIGGVSETDYSRASLSLSSFMHHQSPATISHDDHYVVTHTVSHDDLPQPQHPPPSQFSQFGDTDDPMATMTVSAWMEEQSKLLPTTVTAAVIDNCNDQVKQKQRGNWMNGEIEKQNDEKHNKEKKQSFFLRLAEEKQRQEKKDSERLKAASRNQARSEEPEIQLAKAPEVGIKADYKNKKIKNSDQREKKVKDFPTTVKSRGRFTSGYWNKLAEDDLRKWMRFFGMKSTRNAITKSRMILELTKISEYLVD